MKTKNWILTILAIFVVATGFATETPKMSVLKVESEKALVAFNAPAPTNFEITITNFQNDVVYFYKTEDKMQAYRGKFNFSNLENGTYKVCLNYGNKSLNSEVTVTSKGISTGPVEDSYEPFFQFNDDKLKVSFLNVPQKQVYINVYKNNQFVSGVNLGKDFCIHKCLDFSNLEEGEYQVVLTEKFRDHAYLVSK